MEFLHLIWQNIEDRKKYHVGTLVYDNVADFYEFYYAKYVKRRGLSEAIEAGFSGIYEFPEYNKEYLSKELFHIFNIRLPNPKRSDYHKLLELYGLNEKTTKMEFLRRTKGRSAIDCFELISPITIDDDNNFELTSFIEGWQYYDGDKVIDKLTVGDKLSLARDIENKHDEFAVKVLTMDGDMLGFVAAVYSEDISQMLDSNSTYSIHISKIYRDAIPQMKVLFHLEGVCTFRMKVQESMKNFSAPKELVLL